MNRLSSKTTFFYKRVLPLLFVVMLAAILLHNIINGSINLEQAIPFVVIGSIMLLVGYIFRRYFIFSFLDEVYEDGNRLVFKKHGQEDSTNFTNIVSVHYLTFRNIPTVILTLNNPCKFGDKLQFIAPLTLIPWTENPIIVDFIKRVNGGRGRISG